MYDNEGMTLLMNGIILFNIFILMFIAKGFSNQTSTFPDIFFYWVILGN